MSDSIQPIKEQLVQLFNQALLEQQSIESHFTAEDLEFSTPTLYDASVVDLNDPTTRNSMVQISVHPESEDEEETAPLTYSLHYNRLSVAHLVANYGDVILGDGTEVSTHDALDLLSDALGTVLDAEDFEDVLIEEVTEGERRITLRALESSLGYFGETTINMEVPTEEPDVEGGEGEGEGGEDGEGDGEEPEV